MYFWNNGTRFLSELGKNTEKALWPGGGEDNGIEGYLEMSGWNWENGVKFKKKKARIHDNRLPVEVLNLRLLLFFVF